MTNYPNIIDSDLELPRIENNVTEITDHTVNSLRDAVIAIETAVGINPQGNKSSLADRINAAIDEDGLIKASAIAGIGLVTLPITNTEIAQDAAIEESKLELDYSTSSLNSRISSAQTNITSTNTSLGTLQGGVTQHYIGTSNRHGGDDVDLAVSVDGENTVEAALHAVDDSLTSHETNVVSAVHQANTISVVDNFSDFSSTNVQDALEKLDTSRLGKIEMHQSSLHVNAIENNSLNETGQGNLVDTTLASTIFKTNTSVATNVLQVMNPSSARVTSKSLNLRALGVGLATTLRVQAGGVGRTYLDINLSTAPSAIPTQDVDDIVDKINSVAHSASNHYPISAYNTNGKLTIAHNIPGKDFTIQILNATSLSAATALGFGDVISTVFDYPNDTRAAYINGIRVTNFEPLIKISYTTATLTALIYPGLGNLNSLGLTTTPEGSVLCNITNHSVDSAVNGTYYIASYPSASTFLLNTSIAAGTFDLEILAGSVNFPNSSSGKLYDIFIGSGNTDGYGIVSKQQRVSYGSIPFIVLRAISKDFTASNTLWSWEINSSNELVLSYDGLPGVPVPITAGYTGSVEVFAPNNIDSAIFEIYGIPSFFSRTLTVSNFYKSDSHLYLSSVHYSGNFGPKTLKYVTDRRQLGGAAENISKDVLLTNSVTDALNGLRNNGVISGLDKISSTSSAFKIRGGKVLVDGNIFNIITQDIVVDDFTADTWVLLVDNKGGLIIKSTTEDAGYTFGDLVVDDSYGDNRSVATILEFTTSGSVLTGNFTDRRLIIAKIDKKLDDLRIIVDSLSLSSNIDGYINAVSGQPLTVTGNTLGFNYNPATLDLTGPGGSLTVKTSTVSHSNLIPATLLVDDHPQYLLLAGRGGQTISDDIGLVGDLTITGNDTGLSITGGNNDGVGLYTEGGLLNGPGIKAQGAGYGEGLDAYGGTAGGFGIKAFGYGTSAGVYGIGGATNGNGVEGVGVGTGYGLVGNSGHITGDLTIDGDVICSTLDSLIDSNFIELITQAQDLRNAADGYALDSVVDSNFIELITQAQDLRNAADGYVPYTGATTNVDLGLHTLTATGDTAGAFGITGTGNGTGVGVAGTGGDNSGIGVFGYGGQTNGNGILGVACGYGVGVAGVGAGGDGPSMAYGQESSAGVVGEGGSNNGPGVLAYGMQYGEGVDAYGGSWGGYGIKAFGYGSSPGVYSLGGATNGNGVEGIAQGSGYGLVGNSGHITGNLVVDDLITNLSEPLNIGKTASTSHDLLTGDVLVGGALEVDGYAFLDGYCVVNGPVYSKLTTTSTPDGYSQVINLSNGNVQVLNLNSALGNITVTFIGLDAGMSWILKVMQDTGTAINATFPGVKWAGGSVPTVSTGLGAIDIFSFIFDGVTIYGSAVQNFS